MESLRVEADESHAKAEELSAKNKTLEQQNLQQEQEITSLQHRNGLLESEVEKLETQVKEHRSAISESAQHSTDNEALNRRVQLLEDEAEEADKNLREANEKYACSRPRVANLANHQLARLRQTDIKAGHFERKVQALQNECETWEKKYEEISEKFKAATKALEDFRAEIEGI